MYKALPHGNYWLMQILNNFWAKRNLYFIFSAPLFKKLPAPMEGPCPFVPNLFI